MQAVDSGQNLTMQRWLLVYNGIIQCTRQENLWKEIDILVLNLNSPAFPPQRATYGFVATALSYNPQERNLVKSIFISQ